MSNEQRSEVPGYGEPVTSDIKAFCEVIARILMRCLRERDENVLQILGFSEEQLQKGPQDKSAA